MSHTNGLWRVVEHSWAESSVCAGDKVICTLSIEHEATESTQDVLEKEMDANAKLIAASTDMFEACQAAKTDITVMLLQSSKYEYIDTGDAIALFSDICDNMERVITKAKGE